MKIFGFVSVVMYFDSEPLIEQCIETGKILNISLHGVVSDGSTYEADCFPTSDDDNNPQQQQQQWHQENASDRIVGCLLPNDSIPLGPHLPPESRWWTKAIFKDGSVLVTTAKGYDVTNSILKPTKSS